MKYSLKLVWIVLLVCFAITVVYKSNDSGLVSKAKTDRPDRAAAQNFEMTKDLSLGYPPTERLLPVFEETKARLRSIAEIRTKAGLTGVNWIERGPNNVAGRTRALMFDPTDAANGFKKVWAGAVAGGLWFNNDITSASSSWQNVDDFMANLAISSLAYDPLNNSTFYMGTGEGWFNLDAVRGAGIWKSTDAGDTWTQLNSTTTSDFYHVNKLVVTSSGTVLAGTRAGLFRSDDSGATWSTIIFETITDIEIAANGSIYAAASSIQKSNNDGANFSSANLSLTASRFEIATSPSDGNRVYVVGNNSGIDVLARTDDGGATWIDQTTEMVIPQYYSQSCGPSGSDFSRGQGWYDLIMSVSPSDPDLVLLGGVDLYKSTDSGLTWGDGSPISYWTGACAPLVHADQHAIAFRPGDPNTAIFGNDGGIFISTDIVAADPSFESRNLNYNVTQFYAVATANEPGSNYFLAGAQDNGTQQFTEIGVNATREVTGGDGAFCFIDQDDSDIQISSYVYNSYRLSRDGGQNFVSISDDTDHGRFINPGDYDSDTDILYAAGNENQVIRYRIGPNPVEIDTLELSLSSQRVSNIKVSPYSESIFAGTSSGDVFRIDSPDGVASSTNISNGLPSGYISSIDIGYSDQQILTTFSNYGIISVWETLDGGANWVSKEGDLPDMPVRWGLYNPNDSNEVLLATELGVWSTDEISDASPAWEPTNGGLANVRCDMLKYRDADGIVVVATHGRGVYSSDAFVSDPVAFFEPATTVGYAGKPVVFNNFSLKATSYSWDFADGTLSTEMSPTHIFENPGNYRVSLSINGGEATHRSDIKILPSKGVSYLASHGGDFESNLDDFTPINVSGTEFQRGTSNLTGKSGTNSGDNAWVTGINEVDYTPWSTAYLHSPNFNFLEPGRYSVSFYGKWVFEDNWDGIVLQYSDDLGATWNTLYGQAGENWNNSPTDSNNEVFPPNTTIFSGTVSSFTKFETDVSFLSGKQNVAFRFLFKTDGFSEETGGAIDDFNITAPLTGDFSADKLNSCSGSQVVFTSNSLGTITSYDWDFGEGAIPATLTGAGPHAVVYSSTGSKTVKLTLNGSVDYIKTDYIMAGESPVDQAFTITPLNLCASENIEISIDLVSGVSYQLYNSTSDSLLATFTGEGASIIAISDLPDPGIYQIIATDDMSGCETTFSNSFNIDVKPVAGSVITQNEFGILVAPTADTYQWYHDDVAISHGVNETFIPVVKGKYKADLTIGDCVTTTDEITIFVLGLHDNLDGYTIFPNPTRGIIKIHKQENLTGKMDYTIYDMLGKIVKHTQTDDSNIELDISSQKMGMYILEINDRNSRKVQKIQLIK